MVLQTPKRRSTEKQGKKLDISLLLRRLLTYLLACFEAAWNCHIVKINSAQKGTLTKSYEYHIVLLLY